MPSVLPGYSFTSASDPITFAKLNLLGQPTIALVAGDVVASVIADGAVGTVALAAGAVTIAKMAALATTGSYIGSTPASATAAVIQICDIGSAINTGLGFSIGAALAGGSIAIGQSATAKALLKWTYNVTEASASFSLLSFAGSSTQNSGITGGNNVVSLIAGNATLLFGDNLGNIYPGSGVLSTGATDGFFNVRTCAGNPTGVPTLQAGRVPVIFDTTNAKICVYSGGAWIKTSALS